MHDYDFFVAMHSYYKEKDMTAQFDPNDVAINRTCFPLLNDVVSAALKKQVDKQEELVKMNETGGRSIFSKL